MTSTITGTSGPNTPVEVLGFSGKAASRNIETEVSDSPDPAVTLRPAGPRRGTLRALFATAADAIACDGDLRAGTALTFADTEFPALDMTFVLSDGGYSALDFDVEARTFVVTFDYTEVPA